MASWPSINESSTAIDKSDSLTVTAMLMCLPVVSAITEFVGKEKYPKTAEIITKKLIEYPIGMII